MSLSWKEKSLTCVPSTCVGNHWPHEKAMNFWTVIVVDGNARLSIVHIYMTMMLYLFIEKSHNSLSSGVWLKPSGLYKTSSERGTTIQSESLNSSSFFFCLFYRLLKIRKIYMCVCMDIVHEEPSPLVRLPENNKSTSKGYTRRT